METIASEQTQESRLLMLTGPGLGWLTFNGILNGHVLCPQSKYCLLTTDEQCGTSLNTKNVHAVFVDIIL